MRLMRRADQLHFLHVVLVVHFGSKVTVGLVAPSCYISMDNTLRASELALPIHTLRPTIGRSVRSKSHMASHSLVLSVFNALSTLRSARSAVSVHSQLFSSTVSSRSATGPIAKISIPTYLDPCSLR